MWMSSSELYGLCPLVRLVAHSHITEIYTTGGLCHTQIILPGVGEFPYNCRQNSIELVVGLEIGIDEADKGRVVEGLISPQLKSVPYSLNDRIEIIPCQILVDRQ